MLTEEQAEGIRKQLRDQIEKLPEDQRIGMIEAVEKATPEQLEMFVKQQGTEECLFCGIGKGAIETVKIYENSYITAFLDIAPAAAGQAIIIPKEHYQFIFQMPDYLLWEMIKVTKIIMPVIVNITKAEGISFYVAQGPAAGQRIEHVAFNLIPRFSNDKASFMWERKEASKDILEKVAREIRQSIEKTLSEEKMKIAKRMQETNSQKNSSEEKPEEFPRRRA